MIDTFFQTYINFRISGHVLWFMFYGLCLAKCWLGSEVQLGQAQLCWVLVKECLEKKTDRMI